MGSGTERSNASESPARSTPLRRYTGVAGVRNLLVKDESEHTNGTFKDRLTRLAVDRFPEPTTLACISYGNTALSLVRAARSHHLSSGVRHTVAVVVPCELEHWSLGPTSTGATVLGRRVLEELGDGAQVLAVDLASQTLDDTALQAMFAGKVPASIPFVNMTEGLDIPAYVEIIAEAVEQLGAFPDVCVVPYGAGILCNEIRDFCSGRANTAVVPISVASPASSARMLYGPMWLDVLTLGRVGSSMSRHASPDRCGRLREPYRVWGATEEEVLEGLAIAGRLGLSSEPSGSVGLGVLHRLRAIVPSFDSERHTVLVINTGNGIDRLAARGRRAAPIQSS